DRTHEDLNINTDLSDFRANFDTVHGTAVAALAAASGNNARGLAGVMWKSNLLLFSCSSGHGDDTVYELLCQHVAIEAIDRGARVINASIALNFDPTTCYPSTPIDLLETWLRTSVDGWRLVVDHAAAVPGGVLFVFGAGNDATPVSYTSPALLSSSYAN